jgi:hypothetical protein
MIEAKYGKTGIFRCAWLCMVEAAMIRKYKCHVAFAAIGFLATTTCRADTQLPLSACFEDADKSRMVACQMEVIATYQALQAMQVHFGLRKRYCHFGDKPSTKDLFANVLSHVQPSVSFAGDTPAVPASIVLFEGPADCKLEVSASVDGVSDMKLIGMCQRAFKQGGDPQPCLGYIAGLRDAFTALSGEDGAAAFFCAPKRQPDVKQALQLFIAEVKREHDAKPRRAAAEVMADALKREYPCH